MCKSIYLFINCGFCVWKLHLTQGPGMPGIQIPTFFYRAQAHRWQKPSRPPRWHRLEVLPPRGILQLGRAMSRQMFITSSKRRRKEIPFRFTIENNRKTHRFTSFLSWWLDNPKKILPTDTHFFLRLRQEISEKNGWSESAAVEIHGRTWQHSLWIHDDFQNFQLISELYQLCENGTPAIGQRCRCTAWNMNIVCPATHAHIP